MKKTSIFPTQDQGNVQEILADYGKSLTTIPQLQDKVDELENSLKAFLDMQCMIGEETVNSFELIIDRLNNLQQTLSTKHAPVEPAPTDSNWENQVTPPDPSGKCSYGIHATIDRKKFTALQRHLGDEECTGQGDISGFTYPIHIDYLAGKIIAVKMPCNGVNQALEACANRLTATRVKNWENDSEDNLISLLASYIQHKTQYLGGLTRVLQKLSKKQLIEKLEQNVPPFLLPKQAGCYCGEAILDYLMENWPEQGKGYLYFSFMQKKSTAEPTQEGIAIPVLLARIERFSLKRSVVLEDNKIQVNP